MNIVTTPGTAPEMDLPAHDVIQYLKAGPVARLTLSAADTEHTTVLNWMRANACWPTQSIELPPENPASAEWRQVVEDAPFVTRADGTLERIPLTADTYAQACIEIRIDGVVHRLRPGQPTPRTLESSLPLAVITACDPACITWDATRNDVAQTALESHATAEGLAWFPAVGGSPDGAHSERSIAVAHIELADALLLAARYGQRALFWIDVDGVTIRDCSPVLDVDEDRRSVDLDRIVDPDSVGDALIALHAMRAGDGNPIMQIVVLQEVLNGAHPGWLIALATDDEIRFEGAKMKPTPTAPPGTYWAANRLLAGPHPDHQTDRRAQLAAAGVTKIVDLTSGQHAIRDGSVPSLEAMHSILEVINDEIQGGGCVYVHCHAGLGRTGTVIGCFLAEQGETDPVASIATLRMGLPHRSPETFFQVRMIKRWVDANSQPPVGA